MVQTTLDGYHRPAEIRITKKPYKSYWLFNSTTDFVTIRAYYLDK